MCAAPGCCSVSHFGCAVILKWSLVAECRAFCDACTHCPTSNAARGGEGVEHPPCLAPIDAVDVYKSTARPLYVQLLPARAHEMDDFVGCPNSFLDGGLALRAGALTVEHLGEINWSDERFHSKTALYPIGFMSTRIFWTLDILGDSKSEKDRRRRAVYKCQIGVAEDGGPLFQVTVEHHSYFAASSTDAWRLATRGSPHMTSLASPVYASKKPKTLAGKHAPGNAGRLNHMDVSHGLDGDYMFGLSVLPVARALESLGKINRCTSGSKIVSEYLRLSERPHTLRQTLSRSRRRVVEETVANGAPATNMSASSASCAIGRSEQGESAMFSSQTMFRSQRMQDTAVESLTVHDHMMQRCILCRQSQLAEGLNSARVGIQGRAPAFRLLGPISLGQRQVYVHDTCAMFAPDMKFKRPIDDTPLEAVDLDTETLLASEQASIAQICQICHNQGAASSCGELGCNRFYHLHCAELAGLVEWHRYNSCGQCLLHCPSHRDPLCEIWWASTPDEPVAAWWPCAVTDTVPKEGLISIMYTAYPYETEDLNMFSGNLRFPHKVPRDCRRWAALVGMSHSQFKYIQICICFLHRYVQMQT